MQKVAWVAGGVRCLWSACASAHDDHGLRIRVHQTNELQLTATSHAGFSFFVQRSTNLPAWQLNALVNLPGSDANNGHVQPSGTYHYHGPPNALVSSTNCPELLGFAGDGFPIYGPYGYVDPMNTATDVVVLSSSWRVKSGTRPTAPFGTYDGAYIEDFEYVPNAGDLDECNGRFGVPVFNASYVHP